MFNIPDAYKLDYQVNLKDFIQHEIDHCKGIVI